MQKNIIQTKEGRTFLVCIDFTESKDSKDSIRVLGFKLNDCQNISPTHIDDPNYILNKLAKTIPHIEIKTCNNKETIIILKRKRKPFSFRHILRSRNRYYYESKNSDINVTVEEIFF